MEILNTICNFRRCMKILHDMNSAGKEMFLEPVQLHRRAVWRLIKASPKPARVPTFNARRNASNFQASNFPCNLYNILSTLTSNVESPEGGVGLPARRASTLRVSADPLALNGPRGLVKCPQMLKSTMIACTRDPLYQPNLSHMDFPDGPAAIQRSTTTT